MSDPEQQKTVSVTDRVKQVETGVPAGALYFLGETVAVVGVEDRVTLIDSSGETRDIHIAVGAILSSAGDGKRLVLGCDDGRVLAVAASGQSEPIATDAKRRWIDAVALHGDGGVAWSAGKTAFVRQPKGEAKSLDVPSTVGGLAFAPKGFRLAIAHYNGATLWFPNMAGKPELLEWKGSHLGVTWSPDGRFLITAMHEPALHGWRLADAKHMRMTGYPGRVRSIAWTAGGKALATSGADCVILWPFTTKDGPMGKEPAMLGPLPTRVAVVACHPASDVIAAGYADGTILMLRLQDGVEILVRRPDAVAIAGLAWNANGARLAYVTEQGGAGLLTL